MRLFLIRRTRSFIKNNYTEIDETGKPYLLLTDGSRQNFPERIPKRVVFGFKRKNKNDQYAKLYSNDIIDQIDKMRFPRYGLGQSNYLKDDPEVQLRNSNP